MKEKWNQMFKDKLFLVMLVLGLLTIVAAAGVVTTQRGSGQEQNPYVDMQEQGDFIAQQPGKQIQEAELPEINPALAEETEIAAEQLAENNLDTVTAERTKEEAWNPEEENVQEAGTGLGNVEALALNFSDTSSLSWPVRGNVVLNYSMDSTIYFPTLDQYKCNPGMVIQGDISEPVYAPANARVVSVGNSEEIGTYLTLDLGNEYSVICGQLKEVAAVEGEYLEKGQLIGYVAEPTKYYTVEGSNLYLEMLHKDSPVDPLDYLE